MTSAGVTEGDVGGLGCAFTPDEVREMWRASGLSDGELDSAANAALVLWEIEERRR